MEWLSNNAAIVAVIITGIFNSIIGCITLWKQGKSKENIAKLTQELNNKGHSTQYMFDFKIKIYSELSEKMINAIDASSVLLPEFETFLPDDEDVLKKEMKQRDDHYIESFNEFTKCQRKYKPFYSKEIFKLTDEMMGQMNRISFNFRKYMSGENYEYVVPLHKEIDKESKKVSEMIKNELPSNNYL